MGKSMYWKNALIIFFSLLSLSAFALEEDPFLPLLPKEIIKKQPPTETVAPEHPIAVPDEVVTAPTLNVTGVLWGTDKPMVIINDKVYAVGDLVADTGAKIHTIEKNVVTVIYKMQKFDLTVSKKTTKEEK